MKKQKFKLGLNKVNVSNLSSIKAGMGIVNQSDAVTCVATLSRNFVDICCPVFGTGEVCEATKNTRSRHPGCGDDPNTSVCAHTFGNPCI
ncbi:hypothetical protein [uncultured Kordia sp.]|uniref:hypothetical protein n=1 Tax=uncultured Kordia sp. TaxID=507699 RepID=UPI00262D4975|nr:hypothetical protein [uncultured Kordia sp.]